MNSGKIARPAKSSFTFMTLKYHKGKCNMLFIDINRLSKKPEEFFFSFPEKSASQKKKI